MFLKLLISRACFRKKTEKSKNKLKIISKLCLNSERKIRFTTCHEWMGKVGEHVEETPGVARQYGHTRMPEADNISHFSFLIFKILNINIYILITKPFLLGIFNRFLYMKCSADDKVCELMYFPNKLFYLCVYMCYMHVNMFACGD